MGLQHLLRLPLPMQEDIGSISGDGIVKTLGSEGCAVPSVLHLVLMQNCIFYIFVSTFVIVPSAKLYILHCQRKSKEEFYGEHVTL